MIKISVDEKKGLISIAMNENIDGISSEVAIALSKIYESLKENQGSIIADRFKINMKTIFASGIIFMDDEERAQKLKDIKSGIKDRFNMDDTDLDNILNSFREFSESEQKNCEDKKSTFEKALEDFIKKIAEKASENNSDEEDIDENVEKLISGLYNPNNNEDNGEDGEDK